MAWFKKKTDLPSPPKPFGNKEAGSFDKLMPEIPPAPDEQVKSLVQPQQKPGKASPLLPPPPRFPSQSDGLSPTPELSAARAPSSMSMDKLFDNQGQQGSPENGQQPIDELGFELPDFDENDIRALDELKTMASEPAKKQPESPKPEPAFAPQTPPQPEPKPELPPEPELPSEQDLDIDFTQDMQEPQEQPQEQPVQQAEEEPQPEEEQAPEPQEPKDYWAALSGQPEPEPEPEPEPMVQMVPQPRSPAPRVIPYPEYQRPSQIPQEKFVEVASYALMKDELDDVKGLIDSADEAAQRNTTLVKMKTDKDLALVAELNAIQEQLILIDNKLFETPNQFIEVKR